MTQGAMLREEVTAQDIASVVARWTGIPVERMLEGEREKLLNMEEQIGKRGTVWSIEGGRNVFALGEGSRL